MAIVFKTPKSALNTTSKAIQNLGNGECPPCPECPEVNLETADVNYTENGEYTLTPEGDGFSKVDITVNIDTESIADAAYAEGEADGIAAQKAKLTSLNVTSNGTYNKEDGYNSVTVAVPSDINNQNKTVNPSTTQQTVSADNGYSGLGQVTVNAVTSSIDRNIQPENIVDGVTILGVTGDVFVPTLEEGTYAPEFIGTTTVEPRIEGNGFSSVEITVPTQPIGSTNNPFDNIQTVLDTDFNDGYYYADITSGEINKTTGYYDAVENIGTVFHIKPYLNNPDYDPELRPEDQPDVPEFIFPEDFDLTGKNIIVSFNKANVSQINNQAKAPLLRSALIYEFNECTLAAINYNFEPTTWPFGTLDVTENGTVDPTGYAEIDVNVQPTLQTKSVIPSDRQQVITPDRDYDGLSEVTVSGVTAAIDQNITASNIKDGVTILGVTGTYDPQPSLESKTASYTANGTYTITPSTGYDGMDEVEVTVNVSGGSGTQCPDWSSIGWDCNTVTASGLAGDVAYAAQKKAEYENGTISSFANDLKVVFAPIMEYNRTGSLFTGCTSLRYAPYISLHKRYETDKISYQNMFNGCSNLVKANVNFNDEETSIGVGMFQSCEKLQEVTLSGTSKLVGMTAMFNGNMRTMVLTTVSSFDTSMVRSVQNAFTKCSSLTNLGGFTNLGKAFVSTDTIAGYHTLDLSASSVLTKQSIMNVINNLAAPDDTAVNDATLKLSATSYALLSAEDIAIATAKR